VSIGLGPDHPATEALRAAATSYTRAEAALGELAYGPGIAYMPEQQIEIEEEVGEIEERFVVECGAFKSAHAAFVKQAHLAAGARLPTDPHR
jgi:cell division protein FtsN